MVQRQALLDVPKRLTEWLNQPAPTDEDFAKIASPDLKVLIEYPGTPPTYQGALEVAKKTHVAFPDIKFQVRDAIVDELQQKAFMWHAVAGTHEGEWLGVPGTGKPVTMQGFVYLHVNSESGLIDELALIYQDIVFLVQTGVIPMPTST